MSVRFLSSLNKPPLIAASGTALVAGIPFGVVATGLPLALLQGLNAAAFGISCLSVSVPGRIDEQQDQAMRQGDLNPTRPNTDSEGITNESTPMQGQSRDTENTCDSVYSPERSRTLVAPAGWAFAIWGPIYLGEAAFVASQFFSEPVAAILPSVTVPFVAANLLQSLWCASFRPSYSKGWTKYVSVGMLAGTAFSLSQVHTIGLANPDLFWFFLPMTLHFGWTTAATLVNVNGSFAMDGNASESSIIAVGHSSAVIATALGVGISLAQASPVYAATIAWALAACGSSMQKRLLSAPGNRISINDSDNMKTAIKVQKYLCWTGSAACLSAAVSLWVM